LRKIDHLGHLGLGHIARVNPRDGVALVVDGEHQVRRLGLALVEEAHQHQHHKFHRGVVIVVKDDLVLPGLFDLGTLYGVDITLALRVALLRLLAHGWPLKVAS